MTNVESGCGNAPAKPAAISVANRIRRFIEKAIVLIAISYFIGWALSRTTESGRPDQTAAGFGKGVLHGALMPGALPSLLTGRDVPIYAENNNGRLYKLGYTVGVNGCGAIFFGVLFWRIRRWRKRL